jgi:hypothetical protein
MLFFGVFFLDQCKNRKQTGRETPVEVSSHVDRQIATKQF